MRIKKYLLTGFFFLSIYSVVFAQPLLETGSGPMPNVWIDKDTHHKIIKLSRIPGSNMSFYFHNNPFVGDEMIFYNSSNPKGAEDENKKFGVYDQNVRNKQLYKLNLSTLKATQLTNHPITMSGEIVSPKLHEAFYQIKDSVFAVNINTKKERLVYVFPADFKAGITTINADGTLLGGAWSGDQEKELFKKNPEKQWNSKIFFCQSF